MRKSKKLFIGILSISIVLMFGLTGCTYLDVIGNNSIDKFNELLQMDTKAINIKKENKEYQLSTHDGSGSLEWGEKTISMRFDSKPFIQAGVSMSSLPENMVDGEYIVIEVNVAEGKGIGDKEGIMSSFESIVEANRGAIGFHQSMGHYGYDFGNGNAFEWAQDFKRNDKDIVFVLNPEPFISAGADITAIEGFNYAEVELMEETGEMVMKYKLLKPVNL